MQSRRDIMTGTALMALMGTATPGTAVGMRKRDGMGTARPLPLRDVRLRPSDYATAVQVNRAYLHRLNPDRLLHNVRKYAGLQPKADIYGGWESDTIAGHSLGHYMTALVLMHQQTGDPEMRRRADYIVAELDEAQRARGNGYVGALGRKREDGTIVDGMEIFSEIVRGDIRSGGFDLNGSWSPMYTVHKLFAGLLDIHEGLGNQQALAVAERLGGYFDRIFSALSLEQLQTVLGCEYGGMNESYAELHARTGDPRWLRMANLFYDTDVLDPLTHGEDRLANFHANTQVPKLIGLARIHEVTRGGDPVKAAAAAFFWDRVVKHHTYAIGGNADREYFFKPDTVAAHISEQTCEHCNSYNMLKLTRHLFAWKQDGEFFDFYERAHLNHVMAAQDPATGGFTYMTPLVTGAERGYSTIDDDAFWCCVGSGMESHAKHGDSIFWEGDDGTFYVNLYIASDATWASRSAEVTLDTRYPFEGRSVLQFRRLRRGRFPVALRVPKWAAGKAEVVVNGQPAEFRLDRGYAIVERLWRAGDTVSIELPLDIRKEPAAGDQDIVALLRGPMVLAADLGPTSLPWEKADPVLVGQDIEDRLVPVDVTRGAFDAMDVVRPSRLPFVPFYRQYQRRSAVYFKTFTEEGWRRGGAAYLAEQIERRDTALRLVDVMHLGEMQPERDHKLLSDKSSPVAYHGRQGREVHSGGYLEFTLAVKPGPMILQATYWGNEGRRDFDVLVDNVKVATQHLEYDRPGNFFDVEYPLPPPLTAGKKEVRVRVVPRDGSIAGPLYGVSMRSTIHVAKVS